MKNETLGLDAERGYQVSVCGWRGVGWSDELWRKVVGVERWRKVEWRGVLRVQRCGDAW